MYRGVVRLAFEKNLEPEKKYWEKIWGSDIDKTFIIQPRSFKADTLGLAHNWSVYRNRKVSDRNRRVSGRNRNVSDRKRIVSDRNRKISDRNRNSSERKRRFPIVSGRLPIVTVKFS